MLTVLRIFAVLVISLVGFSSFSIAANSESEPLNQDTFSQVLLSKNSANKQQAVNWLVASYPAEISKPILAAWLEGDLFYLKDTNNPLNASLFIIHTLKVDAQAKHVWSDQTLKVESKRQFKKVKVNNKLRSVLRSEIATLGLNSSDVETRKSAVQALIGNTDPNVIAQLKQLLAAESDGDITALLELAITVDAALDSNNARQLAAIESLADSNQPVVLSTLNQIIASAQNEQILAAAQRSLQHYQQSQRFYSGVETLFFGLSLGSVLVLAGIGLAITFGVMGVINMAHGELIMLGAYTTYVMQQLFPNHIGFALLASIPMAFIVSGLVGVAIERSVIRHLYGRPLETLLATFGISLILQQAVRSIFSPLNRSVSTPDWMAGALEINPMLSLTYNRLYIILFCALVFIGLVMTLKKTPLGLQVRAVSQNRSMARAMGIRSERVDALTFGLGSGVAGVAGVALSQLTNVGPNMGQAYIIDSFMVVVFGGVGNLWGTLVAGLGLGLFNKVLEPWAGAVLAKILMLVFIILFIQKRPRGLFPQRGRAAES